MSSTSVRNLRMPGRSRAAKSTAAPAATSSAVQVSPVRSQLELDEFIRFQLELYRDDPYFVPPIVAERRDFLNRKKNPFFTHAEVELFLARRNGKVVGRIAAIDDALWNQFHNSETGFFGMFDLPNDAEVAAALLDAAAGFARSRGMKTLTGPVNLSTNHDCGVLIEGFEFPPAMMMPYNFRYYGALLEGWGLRKMRDLYAYDISAAMTPPEKMVRIAERLKESEQIRVRPLNVHDLPEEIRRLKSIYNAMLDRNWLFLPMNEEEFDAITARLRPLVAGAPRAVPHRRGEERAGGVLHHPPRLEPGHPRRGRAADPLGHAHRSGEDGLGGTAHRAAARAALRHQARVPPARPGRAARPGDAASGPAARIRRGGTRLDHRGQRADEPGDRVHRRAPVQDVPDLREGALETRVEHGAGRGTRSGCEAETEAPKRALPYPPRPMWNLAHLHIAINHIPVVLVPAAFFIFAVAAWRKSVPVLRTGIVDRLGLRPLRTRLVLHR